MKVLFTFGGLPHYLNPILSRLNAVDHIEIVVAIPKKHAKTLFASATPSKFELELSSTIAGVLRVFRPINAI